MILIVGLGNPGDKFLGTRHNIGRETAQSAGKKIYFPEFKFEKKWNTQISEGKIKKTKTILLLPDTFMNKSGNAVGPIAKFYKIKPTDIWVIHDDLDITLGNYKIQFGKGPQIHNGLLSIEESLGTDQFWNVRVGVENRPVRGNRGVPGVVYSLQNFEGTEVSMITKVIQQIVNDLIMGIVAR